MKRHFLILLVSLSIFFCGSQILFLQSSHALERGVGITKDALPDALKEVEIQKSFIGSKTREVGSIQALTGNAIVVHGDPAEAYFALPGDRIYENDRIFTIDDSRCRLKFIDENVITMGANTEIGVKEIVADLKLGEKKSLFSMTKGKAMFYALKMFRYRKATMNVETVTAVVGVRGTKFGIEVRKEREGNLASRPIYLADASDRGWIRLVQNRGGEGFETTVYGFDGDVAVTSITDNTTQTVTPGENITVGPRGAGPVTVTPPMIARQFQSDTEAPPPDTGDEGDSGGSPEGAEDANQDGQGEDAGSDAGDGETADEDGDDSSDAGDGIKPTDDAGIAPPAIVNNVAQDMNALNVETQEDPLADTPAVETQEAPLTDPKTNASGTSVGYLSGMLTNSPNSSQPTLEEVFVSTTRQDFDGDYTVWARGIRNPDADYFRGGDSESGLGDAYAKWAVFASGTKNTGSLDNHPITHNELGSYTSGNATYLEWGDWLVIKAFTIDGTEYKINHKGHYIFGQDTGATELATLTNTNASYSGGAEGTYWTSSGGVGMSTVYPSSFNCNVNFVTDEISNFQFNVSGEGYSASILSGSGTIQSDGTFSITTGTWTLGTPTSSTTPYYKSAHGSLYNVGSSTAQAIGGAWGMYESNGEGATGIFHGQQ